MAIGKKTGGRKAGTPNRSTASVREQLARLKCDPVEGIVAIAQNPGTPLAVRGRLYAELLRYCFPQLRSIELSGVGGAPIEVENVSAVESLSSRIASIAARLRTGEDPQRND